MGPSPETSQHWPGGKGGGIFVEKKERRLYISTAPVRGGARRKATVYTVATTTLPAREKGGGEGGLLSLCMTVQSYDHRPSHPYHAGTEHVGFSSTRQTGGGHITHGRSRKGGGGRASLRKADHIPTYSLVPQYERPYHLNHPTWFEHVVSGGAGGGGQDEIENNACDCSCTKWRKHGVRVNMR